MKTKFVVGLVSIAAIALIMTGCASPAELSETVTDKPAGFWFGLWNGFTVGFSFWGSLFKDSIAIYHINNNGGWYDFGFIWGIGWIFALNRIVTISKQNNNN